MVHGKKERKRIIIIIRYDYNLTIMKSPKPATDTIYPHIKFWWYRTMLNFFGIVATILKMATGRNFSMSGINSGHHYLPTCNISNFDDIGQCWIFTAHFLYRFGSHFESFMKFCPVVPEICRGQVHGPRKERRRKIIIIIRNGAKTLFVRLNNNYLPF